MKPLNLFQAPLQGISLVEAGAGTGKTYNITSLYVRAILERKLKPAQILVLTFTEAATAELKIRIRSRIKDSIAVLNGQESSDQFLMELKSTYHPSKADILKNALYSFDDAVISTIHGFCQRLLKENPVVFEVSPNFEIQTDAGIIVQKELDNWWRQYMQPTNDPFHKVVQREMLGHIKSPDELFNFVKDFVERPNAKPANTSTSVEDFRTVYTDLNEAFTMLKQMYREEREEIFSWFDKKLINGTKYKQASLLEFDNWVTNELPFSYNDKIARYGTVIYKDGKKKSSGFEVPEKELFAQADEVFGLIDAFSQLTDAVCWEAARAVSVSLTRKREIGQVLTYNDLLIKVEKGISDYKSNLTEILRQRFPVALIDEFQDTDPVQYSIFRRIYNNTGSETAFFMIGDPKQAIYSFRGADIFTYLSAKNDAAMEQRYFLKDNYRSSPAMLEAVNDLFSVKDHPFILDNLDFNRATFPNSRDRLEVQFQKNGEAVAPLQFINIETETGIKEDVGDRITEILVHEITGLLNGSYSIGEQTVNESDIAILVDTHTQASKIRESLSEAGIKTVVNSKRSVFETETAKDLRVLLTAILQPANEDGVRAALCTRLIGMNASDIKNLLEEESRWNRELETFIQLGKSALKNGPVVMLNEIESAFQCDLNLSRFPDAERNITDFHHLISLLTDQTIQHNLNLFSVISYLNEKIMKPEKNRDEESIKLESDENLIQIMTNHASKGLEFPIVFCPYLSVGKQPTRKGRRNQAVDSFSYHDESNDFYLAANVRGFDSLMESKAKAEMEHLTEKIRLAYVALTRAKSACFVFFNHQKDAEFSPLFALVSSENEVEHSLREALKLKDNAQKANKEKFEAVIKGLAEKSDHIEFREPEISGSVIQDTSYSERRAYKLRTFNRTDLWEFNRITSYSSLSGAHDELPTDLLGVDYDRDENEQTSISETEYSIRNLPRGAETGTLLHNIMEDLIFDDPTKHEDVIKEHLQQTGWDEQWRPVVQKLIDHTLHSEILNDFKLSLLSDQDKLVEMEFYFPVNQIDPNTLFQLIREDSNQKSPQEITGYLKGFIDLTFRIRDKYYILDYKSNYLGDSASDYSPIDLSAEMMHSNYDLQYHLYTVALHRYLSSNWMDYEYEKHFGGVFYLFMRGMDPAEPGSGIFYDRPEFDTVLKLDAYLGGKHE